MEGAGRVSGRYFQHGQHICTGRFKNTHLFMLLALSVRVNGRGEEIDALSISMCSPPSSPLSVPFAPFKSPLSPRSSRPPFFDSLRRMYASSSSSSSSTSMRALRLELSPVSRRRQ